MVLIWGKWVGWFCALAKFLFASLHVLCLFSCARAASSTHFIADIFSSPYPSILSEFSALPVKLYKTVVTNKEEIRRESGGWEWRVCRHDHPGGQGRWVIENQCLWSWLEHFISQTGADKIWLRWLSWVSLRETLAFSAHPRSLWGSTCFLHSREALFPHAGSPGQLWAPPWGTSNCAGRTPKH